MYIVYVYSIDQVVMYRGNAVKSVLVVTHWAGKIHWPDRAQNNTGPQTVLVHWATSSAGPLGHKQCWPLGHKQCWSTATSSAGPLGHKQCWATSSAGPHDHKQCWATSSAGPLDHKQCWATRTC